MQRKWRILFFVLIVASPVFGQDTLKLFFKEAVDIGLENNVNLQRERNNFVITEANRKEAKALYAPGFGAQLRAQKMNGQQFNELTGDAFRGNTDFANVNVGTRYTIFDGLNRLYSNKQTQAQLESQQYLVNRTEQDVIFNVGAQFLQVLMDKEILRISRKNLELQSTTLKQILGFVEAGTRPLSDRLDQEAQVSKIEVEVIRGENTLRLDKAILTQTLLLDPGVEIDPQDPEWSIESILVVDYNLEDLYQSAMANRPDYKRALAEQQAANAGINMARSLYYPTIEFFGGVGSSYNSQQADFSFGDQMDNNSVINYGLEMNIPIYQRNTSSAQKVRAKMLYENTKLNEKDLRLMIFREVQTSYLNFVAAKNEYFAAEKQFKAAEEAYSIQNERYEVGVGDLVELFRSTWTLVDGASSRAQAQYSLLFQKVILDYYTGILTKSDL